MSKPALLASVSFAHLNGIVTAPAAADAPPAPAADDDEDMKQQKAEKKSRRKAKSKKRDDDDDGEDDPDDDDDDDDDEDMKAGVTGRARARERARIARVMGHASAAKNPAMALGLALRTTMSAAAIIATMADAGGGTRRSRLSLDEQMAANPAPQIPGSAPPVSQRPSDRALALVTALRATK